MDRDTLILKTQVGFILALSNGVSTASSSERLARLEDLQAGIQAAWPQLAMHVMDALEEHGNDRT